MEMGTLYPCLLACAVLPPSICAFILLARALSSSVASIYRLPARAHLLWLPDSPFIRGRGGCEAAAAARTSLDVDSVAMMMMEGLDVVRYEPALPEVQVECAFCLCDIEEAQEVRELRCAHLFHRGCMDEWLRRRRRTCPLCRKFLLP